MEKTDFLKEIPEMMEKYGIKEVYTSNEKLAVCAQRTRGDGKSLLQIIITLDDGNITVRFEGIDEKGHIQENENDLGVEFKECSIKQVETLIRLFTWAWKA